jgi:hypothetical protein
MSFRDRLIASLRAAEDVLSVPGVMVAGSQVPNLLQPDADSTLVVSDDVDIVIPVSVHAEVKQRLMGLRKLEMRVRAIRSRAAIRAWEIRQHTHARGAWFEMERLFALTSRAWVLTEEDVQTLVQMGRRPHDVGLRMQPPRRYFVIDLADVAALTGAREIEVGLSSEIVSAPALALLLFA